MGLATFWYIFLAHTHTHTPLHTPPPDYVLLQFGKQTEQHVNKAAAEPS